MRNIIIFLFSLLIFEQSHSQTPAIPDWYLNYLFNSQQCGLSPRPVGLELMWDRTYSREFLLKKLNGKDRIDKLKAIQYIGMSKDTSFIKLFESFLTSQDQYIASYALNAIGLMFVPESIQILENKLQARHGGREEILKIAHYLEFSCSPTSTSIINDIIQSVKFYSEKDYGYVTELNCIVERIEMYNKSEEISRLLIENELKNNGDFVWSTMRISIINDTSFLPLLRTIQPSLKDLPDLEDGDFKYVSNVKYNRILSIRLRLGDKKLTEEEEEYLLKNPRLLPLDKRISLIQKEISSLEHLYEDEYSEGK